MKRLIFGLLFAIFGVSSAFAACPAGTYFTTNDTNCIFVSPSNPLPMGAAFSQTARAPDLTASVTTSNIALGASAYVARICNIGSVNAYVALGDSTVTVTAANGTLVLAGQCTNLNVGSSTYLAGITSSSSATLQTSLGSGLASLGGGGSGGGGGGGTPGGSNTQIQYNNAGAFDGVLGFTWNGSILTLPSTSANLSGLLKGNGASAITAAANGTDFTLVTANTCSAGNHVSAITAAGIITCTADSGGGTGTVTSVSVTTVNGVSGTVANPTTTPAISLTLGAITPSSTAIGAGSAITSSGPGGALTSAAFTAIGTSGATIPLLSTANTWASGQVFVAPVLGTPASGVATNLTGTASGLTAGAASVWATARNLAGNSVNGSANVAFANKFIVQGTTDTGLSAAQFLGALATGIVKNTTTTGVLSIASAGTDYAAAPTGTANTPLFNNGSGGFTNGTRSGNTTVVATTSGALTSGNCIKSDASGNLIDAATTCGGGGGSTITAGTTATSGFTNGQVAYSDGSLIQAGNRSGNTTTFATSSGTLTLGNCAQFDANHNIVDSGITCSGGGGGSITANSTLTSGFTANQILISDGTKVQAANRGSTPVIAYSANHTITSADYGGVADVTTGSISDVTITLNSAVTAGAGTVVYVRKADTGSKKTIVTDGTNDRAWLSVQFDVVEFLSDGATWNATNWAIKPRLDTFLSTATWTNIPLAKIVSGVLVGSGGGGGSGARQPSGTQTSGGAGGAGGGLTYFYDVPASTLSSTVTVTVASATAGGAAVTGNGTNGNAGAVSGATTFGSYFATYAGINPSNGGTSAGSATATQTSGLGRILGQTGTATTIGVLGASGSAASTVINPLAGGAGSGVATSPATLNGGASGGMFGNTFGAVIATGGIGSSKTNPLTGTGPMWPELSISIILGGGGAGGWFNSDGTAASGANGAQPGGGGGGGGSSLDGNNSGKGGDGGAGGAYILTKF